MTTERVLVTGGAGFIGRAICRELLAAGHRVRVLDSLIEQVHGDGERPVDLPQDVELKLGDIRDGDAVADALTGIDSIVHLAAEVGVGQSMYEIERYTSTNDVGTAILMEEVARRPIRRIVVASSMSVYGEGRYRDEDGNLYDQVVRTLPQDHARRWDPLDAACRPLIPMPTPESRPPNLASVYALGKYVQEQMTHIVAHAYGVESVALRLWNVYGPGQALSNPYTGVLAIFASRLANGKPPLVFEDGRQLRDFVHVDDVARGFAAALASDAAVGATVNIGSGVARSVSEVAAAIAQAMHIDIVPEIIGTGRAGDIRHCLPDLHLAAELLGYEAREDFAARLGDLADWVAAQQPSDRTLLAATELRARGLVN